MPSLSPKRLGFRRGWVGAIFVGALLLLHASLAVSSFRQKSAAMLLFGGTARVFGAAGVFVALTVYAFSPAVLAHAPRVQVDGPYPQGSALPAPRRAEQAAGRSERLARRALVLRSRDPEARGPPARGARNGATAAGSRPRATRPASGPHVE